MSPFGTAFLPKEDRCHAQNQRQNHQNVVHLLCIYRLNWHYLSDGNPARWKNCDQQRIDFFVEQRSPLASAGNGATTTADVNGAGARWFVSRRQGNNSRLIAPMTNREIEA